MLYENRHKNNLNVITLMKNNLASPEHLKQYSGWGGLGNSLSNPELYHNLRRLLTVEEMTSLKQTLTNAYYTPAHIVHFIYEWLGIYGFKGGDILEPAVGQGVFLEHMPQAIKDQSTITTVELDCLTSQIVTTLYPYTTHHTMGFERYHPKQRFDLILGNPPYGKESVVDTRHPDLNPYKIHHYFVAKSMRLLKEGGILAMVLPCYFLDNVQEHVRTLIDQEGGSLLAAYRLPDDLFQNAKVTVDIVFLTKGKTDKAWVSVEDMTVAGYKKPMNIYYHLHSQHILGNLEIVDIYDRKGLTCKRRGSLSYQLKNVLKGLQQDQIIHRLQPLQSLLASIDLTSLDKDMG